MISYKFKVGGQGKESVITAAVLSLLRLKGLIDKATARIKCSYLDGGSSATIMLRGFHNPKCVVMDSCCEEFKEAIEFVALTERDEKI